MQQTQSFRDRRRGDTEGRSLGLLYEGPQSSYSQLSLPYRVGVRYNRLGNPPFSGFRKRSATGNDVSTLICPSLLRLSLRVGIWSSKQCFEVGCSWRECSLWKKISPRGSRRSQPVSIQSFLLQSFMFSSRVRFLHRLQLSRKEQLRLLQSTQIQSPWRLFSCPSLPLLFFSDCCDPPNLFMIRLQYQFYTYCQTRRTLLTKLIYHQVYHPIIGFSDSYQNHLKLDYCINFNSEQFEKRTQNYAALISMCPPLQEQELPVNHS